MSKPTKYLALSFLTIMFVAMFFSAWNDSATTDEQAHIPSGYSYMALGDYRLNPEHPPLIKDLAAFPLLFLHLNFPTNVTAWTEYVNGQWDMGRIFLYESGNNADQILHYARFPIMLLALLFGWLFFVWVRKLYGDKVGLLALFFYTMSPTFIAHSRYVTTDLAAAFGFFIGMAAFVNFVYKQHGPGAKKSLILCGILLGIAELLKFSLVLLAPIYIILGLLWVFLENYENFGWKKFLKEEAIMIWKIFLIGVIGLILIWLVYIPHVRNYPIERQISDTTYILGSFGSRILANTVIAMAGIPGVRALGHYFLGVLMVLQREAGGNTTYFVGQISAGGWHYYFPLLYVLKEQLAFIVLAIIALWFGIKNMIQSREKNLKAIFSWMKENFALTASFILIGIYWSQAIASPLNIGIRHVLPTFPFIYLLVSRQTVRWVKERTAETPEKIFGWIRHAFKSFFRPAWRGLFVFLLMLWMFLGIVVNFPFYLSYYNELAGGTPNGYKIATDSNYDWGQDLKRLHDWTDKNLAPDNKIAIDYFGGGNPGYYFGDKYVPWWSAKGSPIGQAQYFAVSATFLEGAWATPVDNFHQKEQDTYPWLKGMEPYARAGTSIFIFKF